ncbi:MAG: hypothetical protein KDB53_03055 [Planctomycetes bacterium]|nr:hypothetical protein [Planctomycetota bacterium]
MTENEYELETEETVDQEFPSGEWTGFYLQSKRKSRQDLRLTFKAGRVTGAGSDDCGRFAIDGHYDRRSKEVWWTKSYHGQHDVHYRGFREIKGIWGVWEIREESRGGFHIWPLSEGEELAMKESVAKDQPITAAGQGPEILEDFDRR